MSKETLLPKEEIIKVSQESSTTLARPETVQFKELFSKIPQINEQKPGVQALAGPQLLANDIPSSTEIATQSLINLAEVLKSNMPVRDKQAIIKDYQESLSRQIAQLEFPSAIPQILQFLTVLYNTSMGFDILKELNLEDVFDLTNPQTVIGLMFQSSKRGFADKGRRDIWNIVLSENLSGDDIEERVKKLFDNIDKLPTTEEECQELKRAIARELVSFTIKNVNISKGTIEEYGKYDEDTDTLEAEADIPKSNIDEDEYIPKSDIEENVDIDFPEPIQAVINAIDYSDKAILDEILDDLYRSKKRDYYAADIRSASYLEQIVSKYLKNISATPQEVRAATLERLNKTVPQVLLSIQGEKTSKFTDNEMPSSQKEAKEYEEEDTEEDITEEDLLDEDI